MKLTGILAGICEHTLERAKLSHTNRALQQKLRAMRQRNGRGSRRSQVCRFSSARRALRVRASGFDATRHASNSTIAPVSTRLSDSLTVSFPFLTTRRREWWKCAVATLASGFAGKMSYLAKEPEAQCACRSHRRWEWSPARVPSELGNGPAAALVQRLARVGALDHAVRAAQQLPERADLCAFVST